MLFRSIEDSDATLLIEQQGKVKVLEVSKDWIRVEYTRLKEGSFTKKETVVKLIDINAVEGFEIEEEDE